MDKTKAKEKIQGILCPFHGAESDLGETQQGGWSLTAKELENLGSSSQLDPGSYSQDIPAVLCPQHVSCQKLGVSSIVNIHLTDANNSN